MHNHENLFPLTHSTNGVIHFRDVSKKGSLILCEAFGVVHAAISLIHGVRVVHLNRPGSVDTVRRESLIPGGRRFVHVHFGMGGTETKAAVAFRPCG